jgi:hypothetical protein
MRGESDNLSQLAGRYIGRHAVRFGAAAMVLGALVGSAGAMSCADRVERESLNVRQLQTQLMVAALSCNQRADYNAFITRFRPVLADHSDVMTGYFRRVFGKRSPHEINAYVTRLANEASALSIADRQSYCRASFDALTELMSAPAGQMQTALIRVAMQPGPVRDAAPSCDVLSKR